MGACFLIRIFPKTYRHRFPRVPHQAKEQARQQQQHCSPCQKLLLHQSQHILEEVNRSVINVEITDS